MNLKTGGGKEELMSAIYFVKNRLMDRPHLLKVPLGFHKATFLTQPGSAWYFSRIIYRKIK
jgi:hypothetical protein